MNLVKSKKHRYDPPLARQADQDTLISANNTLAFDLYQKLKNGGGNLFFSPYRISSALTMICAGARGENLEEMANVLHIVPLLDKFWLGCATNLGVLRSVTSQDRLHRALSRIDYDLKQRGVLGKDRPKDTFCLHVANTIWGQEDYEFLPQFLDVLAECYESGVRTLDFAKDPERSRLTINEWVADQTGERIKDLLPQGFVHEMTRLILTSTTYFLAQWKYRFSKQATSGGIFHLLNHNKITVPMMRREAELKYAKGDCYQAMELPYDNCEISMVILFPKPNRFETFQRSLDTDLVNNVLMKLKNEDIGLVMPKFEFSSSFNLSSTLTTMGMGLAFSDKGDFSGMTGSNDLFLSDMLHRSFVSVDEAGTEAVAATASVLGTGRSARVHEVTIDAPFIFLIRDVKTGNIFFIGRVTNPSLVTDAPLSSMC